jgi:threonine/homoserine/homoserine lactone efflux protein
VNTFAAVAGIATVAAITPGPNNFIVLGAAARGGFTAALAPILGVIAGFLAMLGLMWSGAAAVVRSAPWVLQLATVLGASYLVGLGLMMAWRAGRESPQQAAGGRASSSWLSVFAFQFANPKAWVMVMTITSAVSSGGGPHNHFVELSAFLAAILGACLAVWAAAGAALTRVLERPALRVWFDRVMGAGLAGSAVMLIGP